jgi:hypothetical protein
MRSDPSNLVKLFSQLVISPVIRRAIEIEIQELPDAVREAFYQDLFAVDPDNNDWSSKVEKSVEQKVRYVLRSAADAFKPQEPVDWLIEGVFSKGSLSMVAGAPGTKKTYTMLSAGVCVALGKQWLNFATRQAKVLIIDEESGERRIARRLAQTLRGHGGDETTPIQYVSLPRFNFREPNDHILFQALIQETGAEFVVVDALADVMSGGDENSVKDVQPIFQAFRIIAEKCQCAIVLIHHTNRSGAYRGSSAILAAVDLLMIIESPSGSEEVKFRSEKTRDVEPFSFSAFAKFKEDIFYMEQSGADGRVESFTEAETVVYEHLKENGPTTMKNLKDTYKSAFTEKRIEGAIYSLKKKGRIERTNLGELGPGVQANYAISESVSQNVTTLSAEQLALVP